MAGCRRVPKSYKDELLPADLSLLVPANVVLDGRRCKRCASHLLIKWGVRNGRQRFRCKNCNRVTTDNESFAGFRTPWHVVAEAIHLYYESMSLAQVHRTLIRTFGVTVDRSTILRWIQRFVPSVKKFVSRLTPRGSGYWHADEVYITVAGTAHWNWEIIDAFTKFVLADTFSRTKPWKTARKLFKDAWKQTLEMPKQVVCDRLPVYPRAFRSTFGPPWASAGIEFVAGHGPGSSPSNIYIERWHNTFKARYKTMRGFGSAPSATALLAGFTIHYNFLRPHMTLKGKTPAQASHIDLSLENGWADLIVYSSG